MFKQDILATIQPSGDWVFFLITGKAREYVRSTKRGLWTIPVWEAEGGVPYIVVDKVRARRAYSNIQRFYAAELSIYCSVDPYEVVALNARDMFDQERHRETLKAITDYFMPLFDDAIKARDKGRITELFYQFPASCGVERACMHDRLRRGPDAFPELKEEGVDLSNWNK